MSAVERIDPARLVAPVLALLAATVLVLAARYALHGGENGASARSQPPPPADTRTTAPRPPAAARPPAPQPPPSTQTEERTYTIRSGDTLAAVAQRHDVTLDALLAANPGVDPVALRVGQQIRLP